MCSVGFLLRGFALSEISSLQRRNLNVVSAPYPKNPVSLPYLFFYSLLNFIDVLFPFALRFAQHRLNLCRLRPAFPFCCLGCPVCRVVSSLTWPLRSIFLSGIDLTPQSAVASDAATALEAESVLRPLYMDVQATTPLVRMEGQLSLSCLVELYCRSGNAQKWLNPCRSESH